MGRISAPVVVRGVLAGGAIQWQAPVLDKDLTDPPGSPSQGDRYIVSSPATGAWAGHEDNIAEWSGSAWEFDVPSAGWAVYVQDEKEIYIYDGSGWNLESLGPHAPTHKGDGSDPIAAATVTVDGLMAAADRVKFNRVGRRYNYLVGPVGDAPYQTISAAVAQAKLDGGWSNENQCHIGIMYGDYTENVALDPWFVLEAVTRFSGQANMYKLEDRVRIIGKVSLYVASGGTNDITLLGLSIEPSSGPALEFTGDGSRRLFTFDCEITGSSDSDTITYSGAGTTIILANRAKVSCQAPNYIMQINSLARFLAEDSVGLSTAFTTNYVLFRLNGGYLYWEGLGIGRGEGALYGAIEVQSGSTGNKLHLANMWFWRGGGAITVNLIVDGTLDQNNSSFTNCYEAQTVQYVFEDIKISGTSASQFKERPVASLGQIREFDGNRWVSVDPTERVIRTTDDIKTILEAASDGDAFFIGSGTHTITSPIVITSKKNVTIRGGPNSIVSRSGAAELFEIEGCEDFRMEGFTLSAPSINNNPVIMITNASSGSYQTPRRHRYIGLHFDITGSGDGVYGCIGSFGSFEDCLISGCTTAGEVEEGIMVLAPSGQTASGTIIMNNRIRTTYSGGYAIMVEGRVGLGPIVHSNQINGPFNRGIDVSQSSLGIIVRSNIISGATGRAIAWNAASDWGDCSNNVIYDPGDDGIYFSGDYCTVEGNKIYSPTGNGIEVVGSIGTAFTSNVVQGGAAFGIDCSSAPTNCVFDGNVLLGNASGAFRMNAYDKHNIVDGAVLGRFTTTDATKRTLCTIPIPDDSAIRIEVEVTGFRTDAADQACYKKTALVYRRSAGVATLQGSVQDLMTDIETDASWDATIEVDGGNNALITVTGAAGKTIQWQSYHTERHTFA